ncbi:MAG TPA: class I SAM-dependent methyltransferase [Candidatus Binatia bacterium]|nr:class I SAM-dependent methyltransferase [Candidatus Binatia bacterium]
MNGPTLSRPKTQRLLLQALILCVVAQLAWVVLPITPSLLTGDSDRRSSERLLFARDADYMAPFVPTPQDVVDRMLALAELRHGDLLYDLGSGDGRIVIAAANRYGIKAVGFEINPALVKESRANIVSAGLAHLAEIREEDIRTVDFSPATVLTMYLYPGANLRLRAAILRQLKPGSRVVSHNFGMGDWKPDRVEQVTDETGLSRAIYLWRIR